MISKVKQSVAVATIILASFSVAANAVVLPPIPGQERTLRKINLSEVDRNRQQVQSVLGIWVTEIGTVGEDLRIRPTAFVLTEELPVNCAKGNCIPLQRPIAFEIAFEKEDLCGNVTYIAYEKSENPSRPKQMEVIDRSQRVCDALVKYQWEVTLTDPANNLERLFEGGPQSIVHIQ